MAGKPPEFMDAQGDAVKRKNSNEMGGSSQKGIKTDDDGASGGSSPIVESEESRLKAIIRKEVLPGYENIACDAKVRNILVQFAYDSYKVLQRNENEQDSISAKIDRVFQALLTRIEVLENAQTREMKKGTEQIAKISEKCEIVQKAVVPSEAAATYAEMALKIKPKNADNDALSVSKPKSEIPTSNRFSVLEIETAHKTQNDDDIRRIKKHVARSFRESGIKVEKFFKNTKGNVSIEYKEKEDQRKAEDILKRHAPMHTKLKIPKEQTTDLALRGVPIEILEDDLKVQLQYNNLDIPFFEKKDCYTVKTAKDLPKPGTSARTWKVTVPRDIAASIARKKRLHIDLQSVRVELWSPGPKRCFNCFSVQHVKAKCNNNVICSICADHHNTKDCRKRDKEDEFQCYVCAMLRKPSGHRATVKDCPVLHQEALNEIEKATNALYG